MNNNFYVYFYLRDDGSPYYVGKGKNNRAWSKNRVISPPKDSSKIILKETNLSEDDALGLEWFYIQWYGRKDLGTGILYNMTDGGDGVSGRIVSYETKQKLSFVNKGVHKSENHKKKLSEIGKNMTDEHKRKISESHKGKKHSDITKMKISETLKRKRLMDT